MQPYEVLEHEWAKWNDLDPTKMVACSSGTAALHLAIECVCETSHKPNVIVPDYTMIACARAVTLADRVPVFVDCDDRLLMNIEDLRRKVYSGDAAAIMAVPIYGRTLNMYAIIAAAQGIPVIEDLAEAHGIHPHPASAAACWSFYKNKVVGGEEGGAVYFSNVLLAKMARQLRCLGFTEEHDFTHIPRGHNYRLSNTHANLILNSLVRYKDNLYNRRILETCYDKNIRNEWRMPRREVPWVYDIRIPGITIDMQKELVSKLSKYNVRYGFKPMRMQKEYANAHTINTKAYELAHEIIYFPLSPVLPPTIPELAIRDLSLRAPHSYQ